LINIPSKKHPSSWVGRMPGRRREREWTSPPGGRRATVICADSESNRQMRRSNTKEASLRFSIAATWRV